MVCLIKSGKMTALARALEFGSVSQTLTGEGGHQKLAAEYLRRQLQEADEANFLDEEDMHIFGLRPMTDPLDLVCCNGCKKPIKASQYAAHAELCKSLSSKAYVNLERDGPTVNKKPPRKERKKSSTQTKKASSLKEHKNFKAVGSGDIATLDSHVDAKIQMTPSADTKTRNRSVSSKHKTNGLIVSPSNVYCSEDVTKRSSKPLKRAATDSPSNPDTKNIFKASVEIHPHIKFSEAPSPLATKIYYSQRNHHLRRAICHMFFEESSKESSDEVSNLDVLQNAVPIQISAPSNFCYEQVENQQRDGQFLHRVTQDPVFLDTSEFYPGKPGGFVPSINVAPQLHMNNSIEPDLLSNSYSFAGKAGNCLGTVQQSSGSVPVV